MAFTAASVLAMLSTRGQSVTLRRPNSPSDPVTCTAMIIQMQDAIGQGGVTQFRRQVTISNAEIAAAAWPGPPQKGDQIIVDGKTMTVQAVLVQVVGSETVMHRLETLGA